MEAFGNCVRSDIAGRPDPNVALKEDFFAITIGINRYLYEPNLHGAVGDADRLRDWLVTDHGVPIENIINLRDKEATGAKIRGALRGLVENKRIRPNNIVLFYFAGHGSTADAPESWQVSDNLIQMILPSDFDRDLSSAEGSLNEPGRGILDIELGHIIEDISVKKGGLRILVIFDCCHSGSGTRGSANFRIRGVELPGYKIPENINALSSFSRDHNRRSHILLAACAPDKEAYEIGNHGLFTDALLAIFRKPNLEDLTYLDLITQLQAYRQLINWQIPQCEGLKLDRTVFTLETRPSQPAVYTIQVEDEAATSFRLEGGRRHGIANGAQFAVHTDKRCTSESRVAYVVAQDTQPSVTTCAFLASISEPLHPFHHYDVLYAVQTLHGHSLRLLIDQDDQHCGLQWKKLIEDQVNDISIRSIHLVRPGEEADLAISADGENVLFKVKNAKCREYGARDLSIRDVRVNTDKHLLDILRGAVHFFRHLDLSNFDALRNGPFEVQCLKVEKKSFFSPWMPEPNALNLCHDHKIDIVENKGAPYYGFEIKNRSSYPFHAAVFMFNVHNLQIIRYDLPVNKTPSSNQAVSGSLPAGQSLRVGFGDSGGDARRLTVPDGQNSDISFLKIFLSDTPHDYLGIEQEPSSDLPFSRGDSGPAKSGHELFDTLTVPIIIRARI